MGKVGSKSAALGGTEVGNWTGFAKKKISTLYSHQLIARSDEFMKWFCDEAAVTEVGPPPPPQVGNWTGVTKKNFFSLRKSTKKTFYLHISEGSHPLIPRSDEVMKFCDEANPNPNPNPPPPQVPK